MCILEHYALWTLHLWLNLRSVFVSFRLCTYCPRWTVITFLLSYISPSRVNICLIFLVAWCLVFVSTSPPTQLNVMNTLVISQCISIPMGTPPGTVFLFHTGCFSLGLPTTPSTPELPSASSWEFDFLLSCVGCPVSWSLCLLSCLILCFVGAYPSIVLVKELIAGRYLETLWMSLIYLCTW